MALATAIEQLRYAQNLVIYHAVALSKLQPFDSPQNQVRAQQRLEQFYSALIDYALLGEAKIYPQLVQALEEQKISWQALLTRLKSTTDVFLEGQENYDKTPNAQKTLKDLQQVESNLETVLNSLADRTKLESSLIKLFHNAQKLSRTPEVPEDTPRRRPRP